MNKKQFVEAEIKKNKNKFGRWHSSEKINSASEIKLLFEKPPANPEEVVQHGNALANTGNYPVGTSECFNIGISGGCGPECYVYLEGRCGEPQEMIPRLIGDELKRHYEIYPAPKD
jgi:hypothetical protein